MIQVPSLFQQRHPFPYPKNNHICFEEWFFDHYHSVDSEQRIYLPIFWTGYLVRSRYGKDKMALEILQWFIDSLDKSKKYFSICQYDDGTLVDLSGIDCKLFAMSGNRIDHCLPLIYQMPTVHFTSHKDVFCNFIGRLTHDCRRDIMSLRAKDMPLKKMYLSELDHEPNQFIGILARSIFTLCPRGYGQTSFRILEAISQGSIPVYISDEFLIPHGVDFNQYGVLVDAKDSLYIPQILEAISAEEIQQKQSRLKEIYEQYFTYAANRKIILENINSSS